MQNFKQRIKNMIKIFFVCFCCVLATFTLQVSAHRSDNEFLCPTGHKRHARKGHTPSSNGCGIEGFVGRFFLFKCFDFDLYLNFLLVYWKSEIANKKTKQNKTKQKECK